MKTAVGCLIGLFLSVSASAEPLLEGWVRLESGESVADAQVQLFDLSDLRQGAIARALTDGTGYFALPLAALVGRALPERFALGPNYPNPFNPSTIIPYQLATSSQVRLEVFNLLGQHIATLVDGERPAGFHTATWHATDAAGRAVGAGVYIYRMTVGVKHQTGRMVLIDGQAGVSAGGIASVLPGASGGGGSHGESEEYGLIVSGSGLVPYMDSSFRVESGMAPVELVVSAGPHSAGKATDDDAQVVILDAKLRAAIETALGKASGATITKSEMETLTILVAKTADISDLTGLEFATNLTLLVLDNNRITDVSALLGLTNLRILNLKGNPLSASSINDHIPALQARGVTVQFDPIPETIPDDPTPVTIPDAKLRAAIETELGKASGATITKGEMTALRRLDAAAAGISDLAGLEFATNLTRLWLVGNQITDVSSLSGLTKLAVLELSGNQITDVSSLSGLTKLTWLGLGYNNVTDVSSLSGLTKLQYLNLSSNQITDVSSLSGLTNLTSLYLDGNNITDLSPLRGLTKLQYLHLSDNNITDLSPLRNLHHLTELVLRDNPLSVSSINDHIPALQDRGVTVKFDPIPETTILATVDDPTPVTIPDAKLRAEIEAALGKARSATITKGEMATLTRLKAALNQNISDLTGLEFAINLIRLELGGNRITDISALASLTNLTYLYLGGNNITDISALAGLKNLTYLDLWANKITDVSSLSGLTNLTHLYLEHNRIADVSSLSGLTNLTELGLDGNNIADISSLSGLTNLTSLKLEGNRITDVSALRRLPNLRSLRLRGTPLNASSINEHIPALQARGVTVWFDPTPTTGTDDPTPVTIPDANLRAAIAATLDKASGATITKGEMTTLVRLYVKDAGISDLTGLEFATSLRVLYLYGNNITDVSALSGLTNLTVLGLDGNNITDVSALSGLTNLTHLYLNLDDLTDISALAGLTNLTELGLGGNNLPDISALSSLNNLETLWLGNNDISDISALRGLNNLETLWLGNNDISDISALSGLNNLTQLGLDENNLTDISALRGLTNLAELGLGGNNLPDISALSSLNNLETLGLGSTNLTDISALSSLNNLETLWLGNNDISDISALSSLNNLETLWLGNNDISDISALRGLNNLTKLGLGNNDISDISALSGLNNLTELDLRVNFLNASSINDHIPALENRGTTVLFDPFHIREKGDFDIELIFLATNFTERQKRIIEYATLRWMSIIREDLPDYTFTQGWSGQCGDHSYAIPSGERIDDLRIYITSLYDSPGFAGWGGPRVLRETSSLSVLGCMAIDLTYNGNTFLNIALHEVGHVLGVGTIWDDLGFLRNPSRGGNEGADTFFDGPRAIAAFNAAGGSSYTGRKVPVRNDGKPRSGDSHWRFSVFGSELMAAGDIDASSFSGAHYEVNDALSAITVQSLADLGYVVDVTQADAYTLPSAAAKASAKITALPTHAEPKLSCGVGEQREPIYVVDPQGRIVRTISP